MSRDQPPFTPFPESSAVETSRSSSRQSKGKPNPENTFNPEEVNSFRAVPSYFTAESCPVNPHPAEVILSSSSRSCSNQATSQAVDSPTAQDSLLMAKASSVTSSYSDKNKNEPKNPLELTQIAQKLNELKVQLQAAQNSPQSKEVLGVLQYLEKSKEELDRQMNKVRYEEFRITHL